MCGCVWGGRAALEGKGPERRPQRRLGRRLEEVAKAVGGDYCRLQMPLKLAIGVRGTVAGHSLGARGGGGTSPPSNASPGGGGVVRGNFCGGKFRHCWRPQSSNCLTHTLTGPCAVQSQEGFANQSATESSSGSQHLKESAGSNHFPAPHPPCPANNKTPKYYGPNTKCFVGQAVR